MLVDVIHQATHYFHQHPYIGGLFAFTLAFLESLAIIGTIFPGSVLMTAVGALIGSGTLPTIPTIAWVIAGAYIGDVLSFYIGKIYNERLLRIWPFKKYPHWLEHGEKFFRKHGGKSIVIGRFIGPMRSAIPLVAGLLKMKPIKFLFFGFLSALSWGIIFVLPGILLGALSQELPPRLATEFIVYILIFIAIIWAVVWLTHFLIKLTYRQIDQLVLKLWFYLKTHPTLNWIAVTLRNPHYPDGHHQLSRLFFLIISLILFLILTFSVQEQGTITEINLPIYHLFLSLRNKPTDYIMAAFTLLGQKQTLLIMAGLLFVWLAWKREWRVAIYWIALAFVSSASIYLLKHIINSPRPGNLVAGPTTLSYPSGHVTLTIALLGFLAALIAHELPRVQRKIIYWAVSVITFGVIISRLYLGAHWPTDIFGSIFWGLSLVLLFTLFYRRSSLRHIKPKSISYASLTFLLISWIIYCIFNLQQTVKDYQPVWPILKTNTYAWWNQTRPLLARFGQNRFGREISVYNIQWLGYSQDIKQTLTRNNWIDQPTKIDLKTSARRLININGHTQLPLLPQLYQNQTPKILLLKKIPDSNKAWIIRLWPTKTLLEDTSTPLWIGSIEEYTPRHHALLSISGTNQYPKALSEIRPALKNWEYKIINMLPEKDLPRVIQETGWDGKIMLIRSKIIK